MEKEYEIVNDISLAETKEKEEIKVEETPVEDNITPDVKLDGSNVTIEPEVTAEVPETPVEENVEEVPAIPVEPISIPIPEEVPVVPEAPVSIPIPEDNVMPVDTTPSFATPSFGSFSNDVPQNDYSNFSNTSFNNDVQAESKVFKTETDVDNLGTSIMNDVNESLTKKAISPMKATVKINEALLTWGRQVVENGLNKSLFDRFEEIEAMYTNMETAVYNDIDNVSERFVSQPIDNTPAFGDDQGNDFGGMNLSA